MRDNHTLTNYLVYRRLVQGKLQASEAEAKHILMIVDRERQGRDSQVRSSFCKLHQESELEVYIALQEKLQKQKQKQSSATADKERREKEAREKVEAAERAKEAEEERLEAEKKQKEEEERAQAIKVSVALYRSTFEIRKSDFFFLNILNWREWRKRAV